MTIRAISSAVICVWLFLFGESHAQEMAGAQLYAYCAKNSGAENLACTAYIAGFADDVVSGEALSLEMTKGQVCLPRAINSAQVRTFAIQFMQKNQEILNQPARIVLAAATWRAYPCKGGTH